MTPAEFKAALPAFIAVSDALVQEAIDDSEPFFDVTRWGRFLARGQRMWVAHELTINGLGGTYGAGSSSSLHKKVKDVESTVASSFNQRSAGDPYMLTNYGERYLDLVRIVGAGGITP